MLHLASNLDVLSPRAPSSFVSPPYAQQVLLKADKQAKISEFPLNAKAETIQAHPMNLKDKIKSNTRSGDILLSASTKLRSEKAIKMSENSIETQL